MNKLLITWALIFFSTLILAQADDAEIILGKENSDHLWPVDNSYGLGFGLEKMMSKDIEDDDEFILLEILIYPSFKSSNRITVLGNNESDAFRLALTTLKKKRLNKIRNRDIVTVYKDLGINDVTNLRWIFEEVLIETKYSQYNKNISGLDGTTYQFFVDGSKYGLMFGETWSPREGILPRILVDASELLEKFSSGEINADSLKKKLIELKSKIDQMKNW